MSVHPDLDAWLDLGDRAGDIAAARSRHRQRDRLLLAELADGADPSSPIAVLARASALAPGLVTRAPACAGIHAPKSSAFDAYAAAAGVEAIAAAGSTAEAYVPWTDRVYLPAGGVLVRLPGYGDATLTAEPGVVKIAAGSLRVSVSVPDGATRAGCLRPSALDLPLTGDDPLLVSLCPDRTAVRTDPVTPDQLANATRAVSLLRSAAPGLYTEMTGAGITLVPLRSEPADARESFSLAEAADAVYTNLIDPFETLDLVVHEYHHLRLFLLEEEAPLMESGRAPVLAPWRPDLRATRGLVHGIYVFWFVARVFDAVFSAWPASARGRRRLAIWHACLAAAFELLDAADDVPTPTGERMLAAIREHNAVERTRQRGADLAVVAEADTLVAAHLAQAGRADSRDPEFLGA